MRLEANPQLREKLASPSLVSTNGRKLEFLRAESIGWQFSRSKKELPLEKKFALTTGT